MYLVTIRPNENPEAWRRNEDDKRKSRKDHPTVFGNHKNAEIEQTMFGNHKNAEIEQTI